MRSLPSKHRDRPGQRPDQTDDHAGARLRRMGVFGLAGLPGLRDGSSPSDGRGPDLCPALCPVHAGRDRRRGRSRCARPARRRATPRPKTARGNPRKAPTKRTSPPRTATPFQTSQGGPDGSGPQLCRGASEKLRRQLLSELEELQDLDALDSWAHARLAKNQLSAKDAQAVEAAFAARLSAGSVSQSRWRRLTTEREPDSALAAAERARIDRKSLSSANPCANASATHLRFVAKQPCLVCGRSPAMPIICGLRNPAVSASRSATSSPSRCAGYTIANCTDAARNATGGRKPVSSPSVLARKLWLETHPPTPSADVPADDSEARSGERKEAMSRRRASRRWRNEPSCRAGRMTSLRQIESNRRNAQRSTGPKPKTAKSRPECRSPWVDRGDRDRAA